jgi:hypothetical protein
MKAGPRMAGIGFALMLAGLLPAERQGWTMKHAPARPVDKPSAPIAIARPGAARVAVQAVSVGDAPTEPVYNLTVAGAVGEYFANGLLVHNCDTMRYEVMFVDGKAKGAVSL